MKKWYEKSGLAALIWILLLLILLLLAVILYPWLIELRENVHRQIDQRNEETAEDSATMRYLTEGSFSAIYDMRNKQFCSLSRKKEVDPYGAAQEHKGMVLWVEADNEGVITLTWIETDPTPVKNTEESHDPASPET